METTGHGLLGAAAMLWEMLWALVLGFGISAAMQVFVSKEKMAQLFGRTGLREVGLAMGLGAASSSCSYAAAAATKTAFKKGADLVPSLAFLLASTNLVVELGIILWMLMGWRFVLAEVVGAFVMVAIMWLLVWLTAPKKLIEGARAHEVGRGFGAVVFFVGEDERQDDQVAVNKGDHAADITGVLFASMVGAGIIVDLLFTALGITGESTRPEPAMSHASFQWNYTTWLDIIAILIGGFFVYLHFRKSGGDNEHAEGHEAHAA